MMMRPLTNALLISTVLQLAMVVAGHFSSPVRNLFAIGGMAFSLIAGVIYARQAISGWGDSLLGGAIAGGLCGFIGIAASFALGDVPAMLMLFGTAGSLVAGIIGGALGRVVARA